MNVSPAITFLKISLTPLNIPDSLISKTVINGVVIKNIVANLIATPIPS